MRAQFDQAGPLLGRPWPIRYRGSDDELVATLDALGVRRFTALTYAHRPGMAEWLNDWTADFAGRVPGALRCATVYPEADAAAYTARRLAEGAQVWKVHVQVGGFDVRDPLLDEAWGLLAEAGVPVVLHAGSGPVPTEHTGPGPVAELLRRHPTLCLVMAHMGAPEYAEFLDLAETYERVHLDTTMVFTDFFDELGAAYPPSAAAAAEPAARQGAARLGLPEHPARLRAPARRARAARARRGLAARGAVGERRAPDRLVSWSRGIEWVAVGVVNYAGPCCSRSQ